MRAPPHFVLFPSHYAYQEASWLVPAFSHDRLGEPLHGYGLSDTKLPRQARRFGVVTAVKSAVSAIAGSVASLIGFAYRACCSRLRLVDGAATVFKTSVVIAPLASLRLSAASIAADPATRSLRDFGGSGGGVVSAMIPVSGCSSGIAAGGSSGGFG